MYFGRRLEQLIKEKELTRVQVCQDLHIATSTLSGYIIGTRQPDYDILIRIADYFHVSTDYLLGITNVRKYPEEILDIREGDLVGIYRSLQPKEQDMLMEQARLFYKYDDRH